MTDFEIVLRNGLVVLPGGAAYATVGIRDGRIAAILELDARHPAAEEIDASGLVVMPGLIEPHCHFWDPGPTQREDWETGTAAAAAGGIATVIEMPLSDPPTVDAAAIDLKRERAAQLAHVDYALWGGIVPESLSGLDERLDELLERGAVGFKAFMCWSARDYPPVDDGALVAAMEALAERKLLFGLHAENDAIILAREHRLRAEGRKTPQDYVDSRPELAEVEAVARAVRFAEATGARIYIVHMSCGDAVDVVRAAKSRGVSVFGETAPQYLTLDRSALDTFGPYAKCAPPLRTRESVERLWQRIADGTIDTIGSDHAPFSHAEKDLGRDDIWQAQNGIPGIQTMFPLVFSEAVHRRGIPLERLADLFAGNAARLFGLAPQKGRIAVGSDADFTLIDPNATYKIDDESLFYKNKWSPYRGLEVQGRIMRTIVRGATVFADGQILSEPGFGEQILPVGRSGTTGRPERGFA